MTDALDAWIDEPDDEIARRPGATDEMLYLSLDIRARELALEKAVELHTKMSAIVQPDGSRVEPNVMFFARAFYDFLTGEHDADPTEQSQ